MSKLERFIVAFFGSADLWRTCGSRWLHQRFIALPWYLTWLIAVSSAIGVGCLDYLTGMEVSFSFFYLVPVAYATWVVGGDAGVAVAILSAGVRLVVDTLLGVVHATLSFLIWDITIHLAFLLLAVVILGAMKRFALRIIGELGERTQTLQLETERRRRLEREMVEAAAREHLRLAQDLHDGLGQFLSALTFHSRLLAEDLRREDSPHASQVERIVMLVQKTNELTRQLNRALEIPDARAGGLAAAVRTLAREVEQLTGVRCEIALKREPPPLDEFRTMMLFRIVQEAFNNSVKHARPRTIRVSLDVAEDGLSVRVVNNGHVVSRSGTATGSGSMVMKLRAELIGARLDVGPTSGDEFAVQCVVPLVAEGSHAGAN